MRLRTFPGRRLVVVLFLLALACAGCSGSSLPPQANADISREKLKQALDAWQNGLSVDDLAKANPPLYFNDPKPSVLQLIEYKMAEESTFFGQSVRIGVELTLKKKDGKTLKKKTGYLIDTSPAVVIVPE